MIHEAAAAAQALLPRQHPASAQHAVDSQVAGVEAWPLDWHRPWQDRTRFVGQQFAASRHIYRITGETADRTFYGRANDEAPGKVAARDFRSMSIT